ncbi:uncharacterized protein AMSG_11493 [Thecamonas trahens ATCC 50062]|uniref:Uncharacterized protein n=1 Tax=Thecamonas trahens ATCC 50062 TaxID=461836 RepID=A0A0L0DVL4_THETB|nr:hypothetical protein AMSG_11493 [Thecamonas trahens ATCC 50062]KNC56217.1 hypothetical protein AMSG_11493 [Thecamonas trahens ATCC 50062]|eukprot:XP_013752663.1 hypothetical protein AMSG_11493 [Thecamonas trahens ATCC 50062]
MRGCTARLYENNMCWPQSSAIALHGTHNGGCTPITCHQIPGSDYYMSATCINSAPPSVADFPVSWQIWDNYGSPSCAFHKQNEIVATMDTSSCIALTNDFYAHISVASNRTTITECIDSACRHCAGPVTTMPVDVCGEVHLNGRHLGSGFFTRNGM